MDQPGEDAALPAEALNEALAAPGGDLDCYPLRQLVVEAEGQVHRSHAPGPEQAFHPPVPDLCRRSRIHRAADGLGDASVKAACAASMTQQRLHFLPQDAVAAADLFEKRGALPGARFEHQPKNILDAGPPLPFVNHQHRISRTGAALHNHGWTREARVSGRRVYSAISAAVRR